VERGSSELVEAEGVEPSSQAADTQASTSIADKLNLAGRQPVGRRPDQRSSL